ncbi:unnamed protein product [Brugia pahangi]|uniref:G_PROTEIN_RECEP_F1_2 domain-containing protein n=1 Tax=Brugia pahangi TaxID=6280 RepID=A0A0N4SWP8_BRUPA|nr:unnamed protein product [Brugia pahangi]
MSANSSFIISNKSATQTPCVDINEYLWMNHFDLTSLLPTMIFFFAIYGLIIIFGVLGNTLVILSVIRHKSLQSVRNLFIISLSVTDIIISIVSGTVTPITAFSKTWIFGELLCYFIPLIQGASLCFSSLTLTAIAIDRYILIIFPTKRPIQKRQAIKIIGLDFALATAISLPMFIKQRFIKYENFCGQFCTEDWSSDNMGRSIYGTVVFIFQFVAPLTIIFFCYTMISLKLTKVSLVFVSKQTFYRQQVLKRRLRTNRMLIAMVGVFVCCWMPAVVFNFLRDYHWLPNFISQQEYLIGIITHCISMRYLLLPINFLINSSYIHIRHTFQTLILLFTVQRYGIHACIPY